MTRSFPPVLLALSVLAACSTSTSGEDDKDTNGGDTDIVDTDPADTEPQDTGSPDTGDTDDTGVTEPIDEPPPWPTNWTDNPHEGEWSGRHALPGFAGNSGTRITTILDDGNGGLYLGGDFVSVDGVEAFGVVHFDGTTYTQVGNGMAGMVYDMAMLDDGTLVATSASSGFIGFQINLMYLDTDTDMWVDFGSWVDATVRDLHVLSDGRLAVAGDFNNIGDGEHPALAIYDPQAAMDTGDVDPWSSTGAFAAWGGASVYEVFDRSGYDFCVAGRFSEIGGVTAGGIACYDDGTWTPLGTALDGSPVWGVGESGDGRTMAWGEFAFFDPSTGEACIGLAEWSDSENDWIEPAEGCVDGGLRIMVRDFEPTATGYRIGGEFVGVGVGTQNQASKRAPYVAEFDGTAWQSISGGLVSFFGPVAGGVAGGWDVHTTPDGTFWVGGHVQRTGTGIVASGLISHDGTDWVSPFSVTDAAPIGGSSEDVAVASDHTVFAVGQSAETQWIPTVLELDGNTWSDANTPVGSCLELWSNGDGEVRAAGDLMIGADECAVAKYDNGVWACETPGGGDIRQLHVYDDGTMLLAGDFDGGDGKLGIMKWDGTEYVTVGGGLEDGYVTRLLVASNGDIYVTGIGLKLDGVSQKVLTFDGTEWSAVPVRGSIYGLVEYKGQILIGGSYAKPTDPNYEGDNLPIMVWDGTALTSFTDQLESRWGTPSVYMMQTWGDGFFLYGSQVKANGNDVGNFLWFDGTHWHDIGGGTDDWISNVAVGPDGVWLAGVMRLAGDNPSYGIAHWLFDEPATP